MNEAINRQSELGLWLLKDAILEYLYSARRDNNNNGWIKNITIHDDLGLPKPKSKKGYNWCGTLTSVILDSLREENQVEYDSRENAPCWRLADSEFHKRDSQEK